VNLLYLLAYFTGAFFGIQAIWQSLRQLTINVDLLMLLAAIGAACVDHAFEGATLLFLFSLSNVLQGYAIERTRKAINALMQLRPENALVRRNGGTVALPIDDLVIGDVVVVRPGERVPLDGIVTEGQSSLDEASLTGESIPVSKKTGDTVFAGTINQTGAIEVRVKKLAKDSTIARLIQMVEEAQSEKAKTQRWLDRAEQYYAIGVITFTLLLILLPMLFSPGAKFPEVFYRAMTVMVVASPCALIISTPATILSAIGGAARRGVLFKGGAHLEKTAGVRVVVVDKTGTITEGRARVTDVFAPDEEARTLQLAAAVEAKSEHPLAQAIVTECKRRELRVPECSDFQSVSGQGASALVDGVRLAVGNERYFEDYNQADFEISRRRMIEFQETGKTAVMVARIDEQESRATCLGVVAIADVLREDAAAAVRELKKIGIKRVVMLTGDNRHVAEAIAKQAGIEEFYAELRPEDKMRIIKTIKENDAVAMVGDGVNDAPALASATVGIAMGAAGTDVAMETADVVLMSNNLHNVAFAIGLSRHAKRVVFQNLAFALAVIVLLVASALGLHLPLTLGVVGHEGSTVLVCLNGLRLLVFRPKV
jgi:Cd2+/Zn2+-exporting ATPase